MKNLKDAILKAKELKIKEFEDYGWGGIMQRVAKIGTASSTAVWGIAGASEALAGAPLIPLLG
jgi:hypothetical protein